MGTVTKKYLKQEMSFNNNAPYGNLVALPYNLETNSSGVLASSDQAAVIGIGDVVRVGIIPAGSRLIDSLTTISNASTAAVTGKLGFQYVDGVDDANFPQDDDYFHGLKALSSVALFRKDTGTKTGVLQKDAYLILTTAVAAMDEACRIDFEIIVEPKGVTR